jgi:uncharacterized protein (TIRG00374 family)
MSRKRWISLARVMVSVFALGFLFLRIGLGETLAVLGEADLRLLGTSLGLFIISLVIRAGRWAVLLRALGMEVPFGRLVYLYFVGALFNSFLPTGFGGDVVRAMELTQETPPPAAVGTVLVDRLTGLLVLLAMGLLVLPFSVSQLEPWLIWLLALIAGGGLLAGGVLLEGRLLRRLTSWLPERLSLTGASFVGRIYAAITGCGRKAVGGALAISFLFNIINVVINYLCGRAVGINLGLDYYFVTAPLISLAGVIPVSVGGVGVRDWVVVALFSPMGVDANTAVAMSLAIYSLSAVAGLLPGLHYLWSGARGVAGRGKLEAQD